MRGIEAEVIPFISGDTIDFSKLDVVLLGGGSDREQELVCSHLQKIREDFRTYVEEDGVVLAVCGGYQLLGHYYKTQTKTIEGLGILNIKTEWEPERLIRNIVLDSPLFDTPSSALRITAAAPISETTHRSGKSYSVLETPGNPDRRA